MDLNIGQNIKKHRLCKGMTQENLAQLLNISTAAVSKWEAKNTYPDITMLLPLANIFGITVDELIGYNYEKERLDIDAVLKEYRLLEISGRHYEAKKLITDARADYPHDYRIMSAYMWKLAGGANHCEKDLLLENRSEIQHICECILNGCKEEQIRLDALNMQAKLFYAEGNIEQALTVLDNFPDSFQTSSFKKEQLFEKGSIENAYWNKRNLYGLLDVTAHKAIRAIWYDPTLDFENKLIQAEELGNSIKILRQNNKLFAIPEQMIFAELANNLSFYDRVEDIVRIRKKQFEAMKIIRELAKNDDILKDCLLLSYKTDNPVKWLYKWLSTASYAQFVRLRQNQSYIDMLSSFANE